MLGFGPAAIGLLHVITAALLACCDGLKHVQLPCQQVTKREHPSEWVWLGKLCNTDISFVRELQPNTLSLLSQAHDFCSMQNKGRGLTHGAGRQHRGCV